MNPIERFNEIDAEMSEIRDTLAPLAEADEVTDEQAEQFGELSERFNTLEAERAELEPRVRAIERALQFVSDPIENVDPPANQRASDDPYATSTVRTQTSPVELRGRALRAIEDTDDWEIPDAGKQRVTSMLERYDRGLGGNIARMVLTTGSREYKEAWTKAITGREFALTDRERVLLDEAMQARSFTRAMTQTDTAGGFAIPFPIDPTLIQIGDGATNPFRAISRVVPIVTDSWQGISSNEVTASFDAEAAEVSDDTPTWAQPQVVAHMARAMIPASIEIAGDYPNLVADLSMLFADAKNRLETTMFSTGSGTGQPFGIVTAIDGTGNDITSATTDVYAVADIRSVWNTLGPRYRMNGKFVMNNNIITDTIAFGTDALATQTLSLADSPAGVTFFGKPVFESSGMDGTVTALAENNIVVFGDFAQGYLIADRLGFVVEFIPHLFATANNLPSGQRGWFGYWRVGADSVNDDAFVLLNAT